MKKKNVDKDESQIERIIVHWNSRRMGGLFVVVSVIEVLQKLLVVIVRGVRGKNIFRLEGINDWERSFVI